MKEASGICAARQTLPLRDTKQKPCHPAGLLKKSRISNSYSHTMTSLHPFTLQADCQGETGQPLRAAHPVIMR
jgi:hypothetical protein